jgi:hypothetical protein
MTGPKRPVSLRGVVDTFEMLDGESTGWLDTRTGECVLVNEAWDVGEETAELLEAIEGSGHHLRMPSAFDLDEPAIVRRFIGGWPDLAQAARLGDAFRGRGAFRRFKDVLHELRLTGAYEDFRVGAVAEAARAWLEGNDVPWLEDLADRRPGKT